MAHAVRNSSLNQETGFILVIPEQLKSRKEALLSKGVEHFLISPFKVNDLVQNINNVYNPRKWRTQDRLDRLYILDTKATIHLE